MKKESEEKEEKFKIAYAISLITQIGITVSIITVSFIAGGFWLDKYFQTLPIFVIIGAVFSFVLSMFSVYRLALPVIEKAKREDEK